MRPEDTIDVNIKTLWHSMVKMYNEEAAKFGSTMATAHLLLNIDVDGGTPSTQLGPRMGMESTSLSRMLKGMEERGLIHRVKNPDDGRGVFITLTDLGMEMRAISRDVVVSFNEQVAQLLSPHQLQQFLKTCGRINEWIQTKKIHLNEYTKTDS